MSTSPGCLEKEADAGEPTNAQNTSFEPLAGQLIALKTKHEVQSNNETVDSFVIALPKKLASRALVIVKPLLPEKNSNHPTFQHLRRFANTEHLPEHLRGPHAGSLDPDRSHLEDPVHFLVLPPLPVDPQQILDAFRDHVPPSFPLSVRKSQIPLYPPVSQEQAHENSVLYWPCTYNPAAQTIQNAPPFDTLRRVTSELSDRQWSSGHYVRLAQLVSRGTAGKGLGRRSGAVAVESHTGQVVAVAGDSRWVGKHLETEAIREGDGRPEHHALMRVISMVALRERRRRGTLELPSSGMYDPALPLTSLEEHYSGTTRQPVSDDFPPCKDSTQPADLSSDMGYLCSNLDIYLTHEPCILCSMGMVHSRFRVCVFGQRMNGTGGLCSEADDGGIGYGLFWRKELNWRVMTFEYNMAVRESSACELFHA